LTANLLAGNDLQRELKVKVSELSPYYTVASYPNAGLTRPWEGISKGTAGRLVEAAERLVRLIGEEAGLG